jgi:hypothetical protein
MTTKTNTAAHVTLDQADAELATKLKARSEAKKERRVVLPALMAII